jgi:hypothetical protein
MTLTSFKWTNDTLRGELILQALEDLGTREHGYNAGPRVEAMQKTVGKGRTGKGKAEKESWCMAAVQTWLKQVENMSRIKSSLYASEHCLTVWNESPLAARRSAPKPGYIIIWRHGSTSNGHTGIVRKVHKLDPFMDTIEGNTGGDPNVVVADADGVYERMRNIEKTGSMKIVGYLDPFWDIM